MVVYLAQFDRALDQPDFAGKPRVVLIATTARCGSHLVGHVLGADGRFGVPFEYLNVHNQARWRKQRAIPEGAPLLPHLARSRTTPNGVFALKAHWSQFSGLWSDQRGDLDRKLGAVIRIRRRDLLSQAVSFDIAMQTGQWIGSVPAAREAVYDAARIRRAARTLRAQNAEWTRWLGKQADVPQVDLIYEDFLADPQPHLDAIRQIVSPEDDRPIAFTPSTERQSGALNKEFKERFRLEAGPDDAWILEPQAGA